MISDTYSKSIHQLISIILIYACSSIAYLIRFDTLFLPDNYLLVTTIFTVSSILCLSVSGYHEQAHSYSTLKKTHSLVISIIIAALITTLILYFSKTGQEHSRIWFAFTLVCSSLSLTALQALSNHLHLATSRSKNIIIVGNEDETTQLIKMLSGNAPSSITVIDRVALKSDDKLTVIRTTFKKVANFIEIYRSNSNNIDAVSEVWITCGVFSKIEHHELEVIFDTTAIKIVYIPKIPDLPFSVSIETSNGIPTINSDFTAQQKTKDVVKFIEDQSIAWSALILLSPLLLIIAFLIKLDSPGPIIFKQLRYGLGGKSFLIWKFRTMYVSESTAEFKQAVKDDPRITKVGRFLRRSSLDELPQLLNVINGTMSIVGPRPHPNLLNEEYRNKIEKYMKRHNAKPGITGLAQISGYRGETRCIEEMKKRIEYDIKYVTNWSLFLDLKIIWLTTHHLISHSKSR